MPRDNFNLVVEITASEKYFDISIDEIERHLISGEKVKFDGEQVIEDVGSEVTVSMTLSVACPDGPENWTAAIVMHGVRIDGIDWEPYFTGDDGKTYQGWHRHRWDDGRQEATTNKVPLEGFDGISSIREFLVRVFSAMRIRLNRADHGNFTLQFD